MADKIITMIHPIIISFQGQAGTPLYLPIYGEIKRGMGSLRHFSGEMCCDISTSKSVSYDKLRRLWHFFGAGSREGYGMIRIRTHPAERDACMGAAMPIDPPRRRAGDAGGLPSGSTLDVGPAASLPPGTVGAAQRCPPGQTSHPRRRAGDAGMYDYSGCSQITYAT